MKILVAYLAGVLFAVGLVVGGMTQPAKIVDFLDFSGNWDPSLAFVMGGALLTNVLAYRWTRRADEPVIDRKFYIPTRNDLDWKLVGGGVLFGVGWGVSGFCPGPAVTAAATGKGAVLAVVGGMVAGVVLYRGFDRFILASGESSTAPGGGDMEMHADA